MKRKNIIFSIIILLFYSLICITIFNNKDSNYQENYTIKNISYNENTSRKITTNNKTINYNNEKEYIAKIEIPSINLNNTINKISSSQKDVDKGIIILTESIMPDKNESTVFIAAHSGNGKNAYFKNLKNLKENDYIYFEYKKIKYQYIIRNIYEVKKDGFIQINKNNKTKQLILTTCSDNKGKQLIVESIIA